MLLAELSRSGSECASYHALQEWLARHEQARFARFQASAAMRTVATDGRDGFINPAYFGELSAAERAGLLLHEVWHAALLLHVAQRGGRDQWCRQPTVRAAPGVG